NIVNYSCFNRPKQSKPHGLAAARQSGSARRNSCPQSGPSSTIPRRPPVNAVRRPGLRALIVALPLLAASIHSTAVAGESPAWTSDGLPVASGDGDQTEPRLVPD